MNFVYKIIKSNDHEPSLNVLYTPEGEGLEPRFGKVHYAPEAVAGLTSEALKEHLRAAIIKQSPVQQWCRELETRDCSPKVALAITVDESVTVTATEYDAANSVVVAEPLAAGYEEVL